MLKEVKCWKCSSCGKLYEAETETCSCESKPVPGKIIGPFRLIERSNGSWEAECLFCSSVIYVHSSNLRRQKSCGCVPRSAHILSVTAEKIRYLCKKCGNTVVDEPPILEWCCEVEEE